MMPGEVQTQFHGLAAAFYPEHMDESLWADNVRRIAASGLRAVRIGEFWWDRLEPWEGCYETGWLHGLFDLLKQHGLRAILCTPTAAPPAWLCETYPEILPVREDGSVQGFGGRRHTCPTSPVYRDLCVKVATRLAHEFGARSSVMAWHIDNELGHPFCWCGQCRVGFHAWLEERYGTVDAMNRAFGLAFWSQTVQRFDQVPLPPAASNPGIRLAFRRFMSRQWIDYYRVQRDAIQAAGAVQPVTTNMMAPWHGFDHAAMAEIEDVVGYDFYPRNHPYGDDLEVTAYFAAFYRGLKNGANVWLLETEVGSRRDAFLLPGQVRQWTLAHVALGVDLVDYFRWDMPSGGAERLNQGLAHSAGAPFRFHAEVKSTATELNGLAPLLEGTHVAPSEVAILFDIESWWNSLASQSGGDGLLAGLPVPRSDIAYPYHHLCHFRALAKLGRRPDVIHAGSDFSRYKLLVTPSLESVGSVLAAQLHAYVAQGGVLLAVGMPGAVDEHGRMGDPPPGRLASLLGVQIADWGRMPAEDTRVRWVAEADDVPGIRRGPWLEPARVLDGTECLARLEGCGGTDDAVLTRRRTGAGTAYFLGTLPEENDLATLYTWILAEAGLPTGGRCLPPDVCEAERVCGARRVHFVFNTGPQARTVALPPGAWRTAEGGAPDPEMLVEPYGVRVLVTAP